MDILQSSVRITPQSRQSALVLSLADVSASTDIVGDCPESQVKLTGDGVSIYLIDDCDNVSYGDGTKAAVRTDADLWMVGRVHISSNIYSLQIEIRDRVIRY